MLHSGEIVRIKYSKALLELGLCELVNREAMVAKAVRGAKNFDKGAYIIPKSGRLKDQEWYIPIESIDCMEKLDKMRTVSLIKQTLL